jgi:hypothetical protein
MKSTFPWGILRKSRQISFKLFSSFLKYILVSLIPDVPKNSDRILHVCWRVIIVAVQEFWDFLQIALGTHQSGCTVREYSNNFVTRQKSSGTGREEN